MVTDDPGALVAATLTWYDQNARELPWREVGTSAWAVLVSEVMLQQTPVARVLPAYRAWMERWPSPTALASEPPAEAIRQWDRLGYPRRALRLHAAAVTVRDAHDGRVPAGYEQLRALPGVGDYTAAAVASFAHGRRHLVLDTNVRRVLTRVLFGEAEASPAPTAALRTAAAAILPGEAARAARWAAASMELGALVCRARDPRCERCPLRERCAWNLAGRPRSATPTRRGQRYEGTDRQARGRLLALLRGSPGPLDAAALGADGDDHQRRRALSTLVTDGLVEVDTAGAYRLPS